MGDSAETDQALLDRLSVLRGRGGASQNIDLRPKPLRSLGIEHENTASKEVSLSGRLKELRNQAESTTDSSIKQQHISHPLENQAGEQARASKETEDPDSSTATRAGASPGDPTDMIEPEANRSFDDGEDLTLEELLDDLGADEQWLEGVPTEFSAEEEHRKVLALLDEIGKIPADRKDGSQLNEHQLDENGDSDDDSNAESVQRESRNLLDQAMDEITYEKANEKSDKGETPEEEQNDVSNPPSPGDLDLPSVPLETENKLLSTETPQKPANTESDLASRMAALRGLGSSDPALPSAPTSELDELGLPMAPSFAPSERPAPGVRKWPGFTADDEKSWCPVCLEDGTVRCFDCDDDVYCAKCWKDMHVGPRALYDFRGHQWEKFVKPR